jgi:hypothetical protein
MEKLTSFYAAIQMLGSSKISLMQSVRSARGVVLQHRSVQE